jgi:hypothetical protein
MLRRSTSLTAATPPCATWVNLFDVDGLKCGGYRCEATSTSFLWGVIDQFRTNELQVSRDRHHYGCWFNTRLTKRNCTDAFATQLRHGIAY